MSHLTAKLAEHSVGYRNARLDDSALTVAKQCILDWFGVTLAGFDEPVATILRSECTSAPGASSIVGSDLRVAPIDAALVNGATSHALDYDDVHPRVGHPTAAVLPAVLAVGEAEGKSGGDILRAFIAGYEAAVFVGSMVMRSHYDRGFHSTATLGSFGAAVGAGMLLNLDRSQMAVALALAGTQAAGLKSMFGTMAKPFHAGRAAANGVLAGRLAARGFTANPRVLDDPQGFAITQSDWRPGNDVRLRVPGSVVIDTLFKYHAACYLTHSSIEAIADWHRKIARSEEVASIELHVARGHLSVCNIDSPRTGLETKFSLRHTAAFAALGKNTAAAATYSDENATEPALVAVRERVAVHGDQPEGTKARVVITTRAGQTSDLRMDVGIPDRDLARQGDKLANKFRSLASARLSHDCVERLYQRIMTLETLPDVITLATYQTFV